MNTELLKPTDETYKSYLIFWGGQLISLLGSSIVQFTIIWYLTVTTGSPLILGLAAFLGFGSTIATTLIAGVFVDRWDRKKVIFTVDFLQALTTGVLIVLFALGIAQVNHILILITLRGIFQGFQEPATLAIVPIMVPEEKLRKINSFAYLLNGAMFLIGPVLGAIIIDLAGLNNMHWILSIDAITFLIALVPLILIKIPEVNEVRQKVEKPSFRKEFSEGISVIKERPGLFPLMIVFTAVNFFMTPMGVLLPLINLESALQGDAYTLSVAMAASSIGGLVVALLLSQRKLFHNNAFGVVVGLAFGYVAMIFAAYSALIGALIAFYVFMLFMGMTGPFANIHSQQIWQTVVPPEFQGRAFAVRRTLAQASAPLAMALTGVVANYFGAVELVIGCGIIGLTLNIYIWFFTGLPKTEERLKDHLISKDPVEIMEQELPDGVPAGN